MRNILGEIVYIGGQRKPLLKGSGVRKVRQQVEKEAMMKSMCLQVRRRGVLQREDSRSEGPKTEESLAQAERGEEASVDGAWPTKARTNGK